MATFTEDHWFGKEGGVALNFSTWVHPFPSWQMDFLWYSKDPTSKKSENVLQAPAGVEEVQDYTFRLHVAKRYVAREDFPRCSSKC